MPNNPYIGRKCLSIRQPWPWLILHAGKDVENRNWYTRFRGRVLIHAAQGCTQAEYNEAVFFFGRIANGERLGHPYRHEVKDPSRYEGIHVPALKELERGGIVGEVQIVGCSPGLRSPWYCLYAFGFMLRDPKPLPFTPCKGARGIFTLTEKHFAGKAPYHG